MILMKRLSIILTSLLCFISNTNALTVTGKMFVGPVFYFKNPNTTPTAEDKIVVETAASRLYFTENFYGKISNGVYFLYEGDINNDLAIKHSFLGYRHDVVDLSLGTLDSLVYSWVGSYSDPWNYGGNISIVPQYNRYLGNSVKVISKLGDHFEFGVDAGLSNDSRDYSYYDIAGKWSNHLLTLATAYQDNNKDSSTNFENRNTWASTIAFNVSENLSLTASYAHYSETRSANSHSDAFSIGGNTKSTYLNYQTSQNKNQARINLMHTMPLGKTSSIGLEIQTPVNAKYYKDGASTQTYDTSFATVYLGYRF